MAYSVSTAAICLVSCHGGPADHFATFVEKLPHHHFHVFASGTALTKFQDRHVTVQSPFVLDKLTPAEEDTLAEAIAKASSVASIVITDVGHSFAIKIQKAFAQHAATVQRVAYYDNQEPYVSGWSPVAADVMREAQIIFFPTSTLTKKVLYKHKDEEGDEDEEINLENKQLIEVGYFPTESAEKIAERRSVEKSGMRKQFLKDNLILDESQKILVYFGGNNDVYFKKAFPAFLSILEKGMKTTDYSKFVIVVHQHPGAKKENRDAQELDAWLQKFGGASNAPTMILSKYKNSDEAQVVADAALYYQTSMGPQFAWAGIDTAQIGHKTYPDSMVLSGITPSVTDSSTLNFVLNKYQNPGSAEARATALKRKREVIAIALGVNPKWLENVDKALTVPQPVQ